MSEFRVRAVGLDGKSRPKLVVELLEVVAQHKVAAKGTAWSPKVRCPVCDRRITASDYVTLVAGLKGHLVEAHG